jgi:hypothetical protein
MWIRRTLLVIPFVLAAILNVLEAANIIQVNLHTLERNIFLCTTLGVAFRSTG